MTRGRGRILLGGAWLVMALALLLAGLDPGVVRAASITVTTTADSIDAAGTCAMVTLATLPGPGGQTSLREAICAANANPGPDTITFSVSGTFALTGAINDDVGNSGDLDVTDSLTVQGNGAGSTILDATGIERVFDVYPNTPITFNLSGATLRNGDSRGSAFNQAGAIYLHNPVTGSLSNCEVRNSRQESGGAITNNGTLSITNCIIAGNQSIPPSGTAEAGGLRTSGPLTIDRSVISGNSVQGEGGGLAATVAAGNTVTITNTTISGNAATTGGAPGDSNGDGGGIATRGNEGTISITNSTISGNRADGNGGGASWQAPSAGVGNIVLNAVTIANNTADDDNNGSGAGGGFHRLLTSVTLRNTLVAGNFNSTAATRDDISGAVVAASSHNLVGDGTGLTGITNGVNNNQVGSGASPINPQLGPLQNNGGTTETQALLAGSPAINAGNAATCPATDQRGVARSGGGICDIGAYELVDATPPDTTITGNPTNPSSSTSATFTFTGSDNVTPAGSLTFQCQIDGGGFAACTSPRTYTGLADGSHTFQVRAIDGAGNTDPTPASYTWVVDATAPNTTITANPANPSASTTAGFSFIGNDGSGTGVASFQCQLDGGGFSTCTSPQTYTGLSQGSHPFQVRAIDGAGNVDPTPATFTWVIDTVAPDTTVTANPANPSASANASFSFTGSDPGGSGVASFQCQLDGGGFSACTTPRAYIGLPDGSRTFQVRAIDAAGNVDPTPAAFTWLVDTAGPSVALSSASADPTNISPIPVTVTFGENVTGFTAADITTGNATVNNFAGSGNVYTFDLVPAGQGLVTADIAAGMAQDQAGNGNTVAAQFSRTYDSVAPTVTINQAAGQADPTGSAPIRFTVIFSEPVTGFGDVPADVALGGTAGATTVVVTEVAPNDGTTYDVAVSGMVGSGTVIVTIPGGTAQDLATNISAASASADNSVTYDTTLPAVTINQADGQADPTNVSPITFTVVFTKPVTSFDGTDVSFTGSTVGGTLVAAVSGGPSTYTVSVTGMIGQGTVVASIPAGAALDGLGNASSASTSTDNTVTYDSVAPTVTINQAAGQADPAPLAPIRFTVVFSAPVSGFTNTDVTLSGTAGATTVAVTGGPTTYEVAVSGMTGPGTVIASIPAGAAQDALGNPSAASTSTDNTVTYAPVAPCGGQYADVAAADPACVAIATLTDRGVIKGYATAPPTFGPADDVQRAQVAAFLVRALGWQGRPTGPRAFTDFDGLVAELQDASRILANACDAGGQCVIRGYTNGFFGPTEPVTHAQVIALIARAFRLDPAQAWTAAPPGCTPPAGVPAIHAADVCAYVANAGAIPDAPISAVGWNAPASRGWVARALWQALQATP